METEGIPLRLLPLQILPQPLDPLGLLHGLAMSTEKGGRSPQPSEGQQRLQLRINWRLRLLGLALREEIIQEPSKADQTPAPAFLILIR